ncbi:hypothetical protein D9M73_155330 [compost metagenome]
MLSVAEQQEGRKHHQQRAEVKVPKARVVWQVAGMASDQVTVQHLASGVGKVGQLQQQEADEELAADAVEADHGGARYRNQRGQQRPRVEATVQGVFDQRPVQRREDGEQQHFWHREHAETQVQADVGDAVLQRADQQHPAHEARLDVTPAGQRQEHQAGQQHPGEHCEIAVDVPGQVLADQAEGKRLDQRDDYQVAHGCLS